LTHVVEVVRFLDAARGRDGEGEEHARERGVDAAEEGGGPEADAQKHVGERVVDAQEVE
jgi:hypothetical protein